MKPKLMVTVAGPNSFRWALFDILKDGRLPSLFLYIQYHNFASVIKALSKGIQSFLVRKTHIKPRQFYVDQVKNYVYPFVLDSVHSNMGLFLLIWIFLFRTKKCIAIFTIVPKIQKSIFRR